MLIRNINENFPEEIFQIKIKKILESEVDSMELLNFIEETKRFQFKT